MTSTYINEALDVPRCDQVNITFTDGRTLPVGNWTVEDWIDVGYKEGMGELKLEPIEDDREAYDSHWVRAHPCYYFGRDMGNMKRWRNQWKEKLRTSN